MKDFLKLNFNSMIKGFAGSGVVLPVALILLRELGILSISIDDTFIPLKFVLSVFGGIVYALVIIGNGVFNVEMKD